MENPILSVNNVHKSYPGQRGGSTRTGASPAVDGVSLELGRGSFFGLLGPNGAGKTTLLSMICGLLRPSEGSIRVNGQDIRHHPAMVKRTLGLVPQELAFYPNLTAAENLAFYGAMQGLSGNYLKQRIAECLDISKLHDFAKRRAVTYSGGLKRRLNLAIGLLHQPELLILDEPTVGIDPQSRNFIYESLRTLNAGGMSIIYTTHYMEEVEQLCQDIAIMDRGRIIVRGSLNELLTEQAGNRIDIRTREPLSPEACAALVQLDDIEQAEARGRHVSLLSRRPLAVLDRAREVVQTSGAEIVSLSVGAMDLEQVFLQLTGTRLRD